MAMSGTYVTDAHICIGPDLVTEVSLKGSAKNHYKRCENHFFSDAVGHHIQGVYVHEGVWDTHSAIKLVYEDGKQEVLTEKREFDDDKMAVSARGLEDMDDHFLKNEKKA
ncbi:BnaCnng76760D [Brassica napus]|uniref:BnaCnng76760D protein n=1 Tax=Brassica napus TaxID=3708 RepID=A0A078JXC2_BRANA|nr:BnaCnng76760D [Brassica napus]